MAIFKYKARDKFSRQVHGTTTASSAEEAAQRLQEMGYVPIVVQESHEQISEKISLRLHKKVGLNELNAFTRQLYSLQKAGLPLLTSLEAITQQVRNSYFKKVLLEISGCIREGSSFSASIKKYPGIFNQVYVGMVKAAETSGTFVGILERLTEIIEREIDTRAQVRSALQYPLLAFVTLCIGFVIVVTFVIPRFALLYGQFHALLPLPTRILIGLSMGLRRYWYLYLGGGSVAVMAFVYFIRSRRGRPLFDYYTLKVPVFGSLVSMLVMSRFARVTGILMKSGVSILEVLDLAAQSADNVVISRALVHIKESVSQGKGISEPMKVSGLFPAAVIQMVAAGEQTGHIDELLLGVADYYDRETGYLIKNLTTYIEPILIFILAAMVLVLALAIFLPMWNLIRIFRTN
ncbi:MAG: type II secretion system F family protein [Candidatus Omnitrophica bacterium]|nr:type II secretion system F family protein [Candidatus Omnitrophota bacterium]